MSKGVYACTEWRTFCSGEGLALFILGVVSCGVGCVTATASVAGGSQGGFVAGGGLGVLGLVALILCVVMAMTGAVLKAFLSLVGGGRR